MKLKKLLNNVVCNVDDYDDVEIENLSFNSKETNKNGIYFCLSGSKNDGHEFVEEAIINGAKVVVCEKKLNVDVVQILVSNSRKALSQISANFFDNPSQKLKIVSITGTNGKTTTSYITKQILEESGFKVGLIGTNGVFVSNKLIAQNLTTPDPTLLHRYLNNMVDEKCEFVVMEASAHAIFLNKLFSIKNEVLALTNITQDHLDFFKTMENYASVKENYFHPSNANKLLVNLADEVGKKIASKNLPETYSYNINNDADFVVYPYNTKISGSEFLFKNKSIIKSANSKLVGNFNLSNIACACGICSLLGVENEFILKGIKNIKPVPGRFNIFHCMSKNADVVIDYAHTPDGLEKILSTAKTLCEGKLISVFGCGGNRDKTKRRIMGEISSIIADYSIITSDNPRFENPEEIMKQIETGFLNKKFEKIESRKDAIGKAISLLNEGDIAVIAGKGAEDYQEINGEKHHFSDEEVVKNFFNELNDLNIHKGLDIK